ncbi:MAG: lysine exporter LysO family protein [Firmicutes bacterium]|nr:lysine exporter LysO family protein [Bacillota bacterium]
MSRRLLLATAAGILLGFLGRGRPVAGLASAAESWALAALLFSAGVVMGADLERVLLLLRRGWRLLLTPLAGAAGSLLGGLVAAAAGGLEPVQGLAVAGAFGWYSLDAVVLARTAGAQLALLGFLGNLVRELTALAAAAWLVRRLGRAAAVAAAGATAMDTSLGVLVRAGGAEAGVEGFLSGLVLSALVPILLGFLGRWL